MSPMRTSTAVAAMLALSACATAPRVVGRPADAKRAFAIADLIGQSPAEVRRRIWAREPDHDYVSEARLTPDGEVVIRASLDMMRAGGTCSSGSRLQFRLQGDRPLVSFPRFVFRDGRLEAMLPLTGDTALTADQQLTVTCTAAYGSNPADEIGGLVVYGPWAALWAAGKLPETFDRASVRGELARLKLGEPPPGGLDSYARRPPADVEVITEGPGAALLLVSLGRGRTGQRADLVRVKIAEDRVVSIAKDTSNFVPCWLEADRALHCGGTAAPL